MAQLLNEKKHTFSGWPMIIAWAAMLIFTLHSCTRMVAAGDTWVAMACGRHFINHGVDTVEPFSANSHKAGPTAEDVANWPKPAQWVTNLVGLETVKKIHPTGWVNQNWLTHVMFYWLTHESPVADADTYSFDTLVYWKVALYIASVICIYYTGRIIGANPALSAAFACAALFAARSFLDIRPAGFSNLLVAVFLLVLVLATYRNILYLWMVVPISVFWCNLHGGYIYIFIMLAVFFGLHLLERVPVRWTTVLYNVAVWLALYQMGIKFLQYKPSTYEGNIFDTIKPFKDPLLYVTLFLSLVALAMPFFKKIKDVPFYGYFIASTFIIAVCSFTRFLSPPDVQGFRQDFRDTVLDHISSAQIGFVLKVTLIVLLGISLIKFRDRMLRFSTRKLIHIGGAGIVSFIACLIFNPFHLTNFTHTFEISVSEHAGMWRTVHEWHPAFSWSNPVGTGFPFLVITLVTVGLVLFWIFSRYMENKRQELSSSAGFTSSLTVAIGCSAIVFCCYIVFISLSLTTALSGFFITLLLSGIILLSILLNVHLIYLLAPVLLIIIEITKKYSLETGNTAYPGTYVYPFLIIPVYAALFPACRLFSQRPKYRPLNIVFVILTASAAVLAMILLISPNPLNIKPVSQAESAAQYVRQYWNIIRPWRPPYEANLDALSGFYNKYLFRSLYIINLAAIGLWFALPGISKFFRSRKAEERPALQYVSPPFDLVYILIAMLTVYMAVVSRRFIPIAAFAVAPVAAMLLSQTVRTFSAGFNYFRTGSYSVRQMSRAYQNTIAIILTAVLAVFTAWFGFKLKEVYFDPWPMDYKFDSVFMRMTASYAKPFYAMGFIRENKLSGKMFNYWTEGGFIAYGQTPDPNTGKTPLRLFMDGRAQAAYQPAAFKRWQYIMAGTAVGSQLLNAAEQRGRSTLTRQEYRTIGNALTKELRKENAWLVMMPLNVKAEMILNSLEAHPDWVLIFYNDKQKLYVDTRTSQGGALLEAMLNGTLKYPDQFSKHMTLGYYLLTHESSPDAAQQGLKHAAAALELIPCQHAIYEVFISQNKLMPYVGTVCQNYVDDFIKNQEKYKSENGFMHRLVVATHAAGFLSQALKNPQERNESLEDVKVWTADVKEISRKTIW